MRRDGIGIVKYAIAWSQNFHRSFFYGNPAPAQLRGEWREVAAVEVAGAGVVLHDQGAARGNIVQQLLVVGGNFFLGVVGANAKHNGSVFAQVFSRDLLRGHNGYVNTDLL